MVIGKRRRRHRSEYDKKKNKAEGVFNRFSLVLAILIAFVGINATSKAFAASGSITVHKGDMKDVPAQTLNIVKDLDLRDAIITSDNGCFYTKATEKSADYQDQDVYQVLLHHEMNLSNLSLTWKKSAVDSDNRTCDVTIKFSNFKYPDGRPDEDSPIITSFGPNDMWFGPNPGTDTTKKHKQRAVTADAELKFTSTQSGTEASGIYLLSFRDLDQIDKSLTQTVESVTLVDGYIGDSYIPTNSTLDITNGNKTYSATTSIEAPDYTAGFVAPVKATSHFHIEEPGWAFAKLFDNSLIPISIVITGGPAIVESDSGLIINRTHSNYRDGKLAADIQDRQDTWGKDYASANTTRAYKITVPDGFYISYINWEANYNDSFNFSPPEDAITYTFTTPKINLLQNQSNKIFSINIFPMRYAIWYNANGGTGDTPLTIIHYNESKALETNQFTYPNKKFVNWNTKPDGSGISYSDKQVVRNLITGTANNGHHIKLYAQWKSTIHTVTFIDGYTNEKISSISVNDGDSATPPNIPLHTGYTSTGWDSDLSAVTSDMTVTVNYRANNYTIQFDKNNTNATGTMPNLSMEYDKSKNLSANAFSYSGYRFLNWNTKSDGSGQSYSDKQSVKNLTATNGGTVTLYAQWVPNIYTVTFVDGLTHETITQQQVNHGKSATPPAYPVHTGYTPTGWDKTTSNITADTTITVNFRANNYIIKFDKNSNRATGTMPDMQMEYGQSKTLSRNAFALAGSSWFNWNTEANGSGRTYTDRQQVSNLVDADGGEITLYAQWATNAYTVTFVDGKTGRNISNVSVDYGGSVTPPAYPTHPGYTPTGWDKSTANVTQNMTVTVNYRPNRYRIHFDGNATGVTGSMADMDIEYDKAKSLTTNAYTLDGHSWLSWNTAANGSGKTYTNGQSVKNLTEADGGTVTLYAQWSTNAYTVTFIDGHDGQTIKQESVKYGGAATAPDAPEHEGYTSTQWDKRFDNVTSNITVTLEYIANEYVINFDGNGATGGNMQPLPMQYDKEKNLTANEFAREGYTWSGWNTKAGGNGTGYTDKQAVRNLTSENNGSVTLYAQWTSIAYRIQFDKNSTDATGETASMGMTFDVAKNLTTNGFTSPSSKFNCWNSKPDGSGQAYANGQSVKNLTKAPNDVVTLYAQWNTNSYTVTFVDGHDGKTISTPSVKYGGNATPPTKPAHKGYTATTWDGNYRNVTHDETVTLQYRPNAYKIAFKPNGGTGTMTDQQMEYDKAKALDRNAFTRTGYTFTGWKEQDAGTKHADGETVKNLTSIDGETITLLAQWEPNAYIIKYNANGGTGTMNDQQMKYDTTAQLTANAYRKTGYTFTGWRQDDKATGTKYRNRETVTNLLSANGATTTMYAQWKANEYTVTFIDGHDGKTIATKTVAYGSNATEPNKPTHEGYTATSWDKPLSNIIGDTVITLSYRPNAYTIRFDKNASDATGSTADKRMKYDKPGNLTRNGYSRIGYTWFGWSSSADGNGTMYSDGQNVVNLTSEDGGTVTLYAVWKINRYTVTFIDGKTGDVIGRQEVDYGSDASFPSVPSHAGYIHGEWSGNGKNITGDTLITMPYIPISYTVAFDKNCDTASGKTPSQSMRYDQKDNLTANGFSRDGYTFSGWNAKRNASGQQYSDRQSVMNLTDKNGSTVTLYAQWVENGHVSILYKAETDDNAQGNGNSVSNAMDDLNPVTGMAKGSTAAAGKAYDFVGWYDEEGKKISESAKFIPGKPSDGKWKNASYTAKFSRKVFTVRFLGKDGNVIKEDSVKYGNDATAPEAPSIDGYEFSKWDKKFANVTTNLDVTAVYTALKKDDENTSKGNANETEDSNGNAPSTTDNLIQTGIEVGVPAIGAISLAAITDAYRRKRRR